MSNKFLRRQTTVSKSQNIREIYCYNTEFNQNFPSNKIRTAKYTLYSFFPKALFLEFMHISNCYFLLIAILQCIPQISPLSPFSAIAPLTIVISLSLLREFFEDRVRQKYDQKNNDFNARYLNSRSGEFDYYTWGEIMVGDIITVKDNEIFPADILIIECSGQHGLCYIETSSLDGEKNLKLRAIPDELHLDWGSPMRFEGKMTVSHPNSSINEFSGVLHFMKKKVSLKANNLMLRGSKLKNTQYVIGVVVYTGLETKIMKNSERSKVKCSHIQQKTNETIILVFFFQLILCVISAVGNFSWNYLYADLHSYLQIEDDPELSSFLSFFSYFLLNNTMIPISLIVTLEFVKLAQAYFITQDVDFIPKDGSGKEEKAISVFSSSLNEELGKVEYIFSDKTGTLTCNIMEFKYALIGSQIFGGQLMKKNATFKDSLWDGRFAESLKVPGNKLNWKIATRTVKRQGFTIRNEKQLIKEYLLGLATCHECIVERDRFGKPVYQVYFLIIFVI